eukprot:1160369-Pelagomonas_calceolata.AAC.2
MRSISSGYIHWLMAGPPCKGVFCLTSARTSCRDVWIREREGQHAWLDAKLQSVQRASKCAELEGIELVGMASGAKCTGRGARGSAVALHHVAVPYVMQIPV